MLASHGVDWVGFPLRLDIHKPDVSESNAKCLMHEVLQRAMTPVLITYVQEANELLDLADELGVDHIQLHGPVSVENCRLIKQNRPKWTIIKSLVVGHPLEPDPLVLADSLQPYVDWFITDTYDPATGASGATGKVHDWNLAAALVKSVNKPVMLAGGLSGHNVAAAIGKTNCAGVDAHSKLEDRYGKKQSNKVSAFVRKARQAALKS